MAIDTRIKGRLPGPGPYVARVTNLLDTTYMGSMEVVLQKGYFADADLQSQTYIVRYLSPFYGVTDVKYEGTDQRDFNSVQKSYGMWMVPPDPGTSVLVIFVDGDPNQGFWMGCIPDQFQNHMVPGIAASQNVHITPEQELKYGTKNLPVAEFHKKSIKQQIAPGSQQKPIHPFADRLLSQGLLLDNIRGVTSSSARREIPSAVFGISTPGPIDRSTNATKGLLGYEEKANVFVSRLGGSTFVMDDGDVNGQNELVRIRTRTGHQILLHNSSDLIYIANSKGTAWIELTSNGKIDIFAQDSVSIHTENDFNFRADRDVNIEAGRNINMNAYGGIDINCVDRYNLICNKDGKLRFGADLHVTADSDIFTKSGATTHIKSGTDMYTQAGSTMNLVSGSDWKLTSAASTNITAKTNHKETATRIDMNGPIAAPAIAAVTASLPPKLPVFSLPNRDVQQGWSNGKFYKTADDIVSIMKRVPTHEPWDQHENINPSRFTPNATTNDSYDPQVNTIDTGKDVSQIFKQAPAVKGTPPTPTGNIEEDNIAAFLWMIRVCEGTSGPEGYQVMFTGKLFPIDDPAYGSYQWKDHPRIANKGGGITSTAAGAYQFLASTWDEVKKSLKLPDFSPASQDKACIFLLRRRRALEDVRNGNFSVAINKCNKEWASLPGSPYNQNPKPLNVALGYYKSAGGTAVA